MVNVAAALEIGYAMMEKVEEEIGKGVLVSVRAHQWATQAIAEAVIWLEVDGGTRVRVAVHVVGPGVTWMHNDDPDPAGE